MKVSPHMNLTAQLTKFREETQGASRPDKARLASEMAKHFEKLGEYEAACEAVIDFWPDRDEAPRTEGLDDLTKAELLLRIGSLAARVGSADQTEGSQETAKNLIT